MASIYSEWAISVYCQHVVTASLVVTSFERGHDFERRQMFGTLAVAHAGRAYVRDDG